MNRILFLLILAAILSGCRSSKVEQSESASFETASLRHDSLVTSQKSDSLAQNICFAADSLIIIFDDMTATDSASHSTELRQYAGDVADDDNLVIMGNVTASPSTVRIVSNTQQPSRKPFHPTAQAAIQSLSNPAAQASPRPKAIKMYGVNLAADSKVTSVHNTSTRESNDSSSLLSQSRVEGKKRNRSVGTVFDWLIPIILFISFALFAIRKVPK